MNPQMEQTTKHTIQLNLSVPKEMDRSLFAFIGAYVLSNIWRFIVTVNTFKARFVIEHYVTR